KFRQIVDEKFDHLNVDNNDYVSQIEWMKQADVLQELVKGKGNHPDEIKRFRDALVLFSDGLGLFPGTKMNKEQLFKAGLQFAKKQHDLKRLGKETVYEKVYNALFDVVDTNNDGTLSLDEVKIMMKTFHDKDDPGAAEALFNMADKNKNGKIERGEFINFKFNAMFNP
ncbi:EF-hand domain-containing protein, partial [Salmonella sp. s54925]|uniref:EF-hand domain-containing protein n=1 Tax=Salmonella sp. s54925 TaxID=3159674 RepID=UPI0039814CC9